MGPTLLMDFLQIGKELDHAIHESFYDVPNFRVVQSFHLFILYHVHDSSLRIVSVLGDFLFGLAIFLVISAVPAVATVFTLSIIFIIVVRALPILSTLKVSSIVVVVVVHVGCTVRGQVRIIVFRVA
jgi:hypothetical protein